MEPQVPSLVINFFSRKKNCIENFQKDNNELLYIVFFQFHFVCFVGLKARIINPGKWESGVGICSCVKMIRLCPYFTYCIPSHSHGFPIYMYIFRCNTSRACLSLFPFTRNPAKNICEYFRRERWKFSYSFNFLFPNVLWKIQTTRCD